MKIEDANKKRVGENIKARREFLKITQESLAQVVGTGPNYIGAIENGRRAPSDKLLNKIAAALGTGYAELKIGPKEGVVEVDEDLQLLQSEIARLYATAKADTPLKKHKLMAEMLSTFKALDNEGHEPNH